MTNFGTISYSNLSETIDEKLKFLPENFFLLVVWPEQGHTDMTGDSRRMYVHISQQFQLINSCQLRNRYYSTNKRLYKTAFQ